MARGYGESSKGPAMVRPERYLLARRVSLQAEDVATQVFASRHDWSQVSTVKASLLASASSTWLVRFINCATGRLV